MMANHLLNEYYHEFSIDSEDDDKLEKELDKYSKEQQSVSFSKNNQDKLEKYREIKSNSIRIYNLTHDEKYFNLETSRKVLL
jgi:hypothetical protein